MTVNGVVRPGTFSAGQSFEIISDGVSTWTVTTANGQSTSGTVRIDADGAPDVTPGTPRADGGGVYVTGTRSVDVICRDTSLVACDLDDRRTRSTSVPIENGAPLPAAPGTYTLTYRSTDQVGNVSGGTRRHRDPRGRRRLAGPRRRSTATPTDPLSIGVPVDIATPFTDASAPYDTLTATIDWGDGSPEETIALVTPGSPNEGGTITGNHVFDAVGSYTVAITLTDSTDRAATTSVDVLVVDLDAGPVIRNFSLPTNEQPIGATVDLSAVFSDDSVPADFFTGSIDWGGRHDRGRACSSNRPWSTNGQAAGSHEYDVAGVFEIVFDHHRLDRAFGRGRRPRCRSSPLPGIRSSAPSPGRRRRRRSPTAVAVSATFGDASGPLDTYTATIDWGDGTSSIAEVVPPTASRRRHHHRRPHLRGDRRLSDHDHGHRRCRCIRQRVVRVRSRVRPDDQRTSEWRGFLLVGARGAARGPGRGGPAFRYNARYKNNPDPPVGDTQFRLLGDFLFRSTTYDYLIINDAMAIAEGVGTMGGGTSTGSGFRASTTGGLDLFQITIWDPTTGEVRVRQRCALRQRRCRPPGGNKVKDK